MVLVEVTPTGHDWKEDWIVEYAMLPDFNVTLGVRRG